MTAPTSAVDVNQPSLQPAAPTGRRLSWQVLLLVIAGALALTSIVRIITGADGITNVSQMSTALQLAVPIGLAGLGGLWAERAGVVNIGLEGMMILGTWFGAWAASSGVPGPASSSASPAAASAASCTPSPPSPSGSTTSSPVWR